MPPTVSPTPAVAQRPARLASSAIPSATGATTYATGAPCPTRAVSRTGRAAPSAVGALPSADRLRTPCVDEPARRRRPLARYVDWSAHAREVVAQRGSRGSILVVDRDAATLADRRLLAHLGADEPVSNAELVCNRYLAETNGRGCRCRALRTEDFETVPFAELETAPQATVDCPDVSALELHGRCFRLEPLSARLSIPELRWCSRPPSGAGGEPLTVSVREVVGWLESYEPVRALTLRALAARNGGDGHVSTAVLRTELERLQRSPIVLNRRLRAVALATIERDRLSISEIAIRCGRVKRDRRGNESGETSWLSRRLGILPEAGRSQPTPWIHSDVLALIARRGLGVSPHEVEL
jgi:hypothetical protein